MALSRQHDPYSPHSVPVPEFREPPPAKRPQIAADEAEAGREPQPAAEPASARGRRAQPPATRRRAPRRRRAGQQ